MTPGSPSLVAAALLVALTGPARGEPLPDRGLFPDLAPRVQLVTPAWLRGTSRLVYDRRHSLLTVYRGAVPTKVYAAARSSGCAGDTLSCLALSSEARRELAALAVTPAPVDRAPGRDSDGDGIVDALDVLVGAKKVLLDAAPYIATYRKLAYPGGDVPRTEGVCTDVIVRALRNAGIDLQKELAEDLRRARKAYAAIKTPDPNIDHRRVKNLQPWFARHWRRVPAGEPLAPGDVVLFDTFPSKPGPDHIGIVSDRVAQDGRPAIINSWTEGWNVAEMDLLATIAVTDVFRAPE